MKGPIARVLRSVFAVLAGIVAISMLVEAIEFGLVTLVNGAPTTDPETYYSIRNRPEFLGLKLVYNTGAAAAGGYLTALIAGYAGLRHGLALATLQTLAFGYVLTQPDLARWLSTSMWATLVGVSFIGIMAGARARVRSAAKGQQPQ